MIDDRAIILNRHGQAPTLEPVRIEAPRTDEVLVRVIASGVCRTDLVAMRDARACPVVLGHEGAGIVAAVGDNVNSHAVGDHVVINWQPKCGTCKNCRRNRQQLCEDIRSTAAPRVWRGDEPLAVMLNAGTFCGHVVVPASGAVKIRDDVPHEIAAMLGCAVATGLGAALNRPAADASDTAVVIGVGGVGLNIVQGLRLDNVHTIVAIDRDPAHLELAQILGATVCVEPGTDPVRAVHRATDGRGADHVFEAVGSPPMMALAIGMLARGGTLSLVGAASRDSTLALKPREFMSRQQQIRGCIYGDINPIEDLPKFADLYATGRLQLNALHTDTVGLEDVPALFRHAPRGIRTIVRLAA